MANALYDKGREKFLKGEISWTDPATKIKVVLVDTNYTPNLSSHEFLSDIPLTSRVAISDDLSNRQATSGVASANNIVISGISIGKVIKYIVLFKDTNNTTTSPLIAYIDTASGLNPQNGVTTDTNNIQIQWDTGPNKIFKL